MVPMGREILPCRDMAGREKFVVGLKSAPPSTLLPLARSSGGVSCSSRWSTDFCEPVTSRWDTPVGLFSSVQEARPYIQ